MRLFFDDIIGDNHCYVISDGDWFPSSEENPALQATSTLIVSRRDRETVLLEGKLECRRGAACHRCGAQLEENLQSEFMYLNKKSCRCQPDHGKSPFAVLKKLKNQ